MVESVVSLAIVCQFLCMATVNSLPMSEDGVTMGTMLVYDCGLSWDNRLLLLWVKAFLCF